MWKTLRFPQYLPCQKKLSPHLHRNLHLRHLQTKMISLLINKLAHLESLPWGSEEDRKFDNEELKQQKEQLKTRLEDINTNLGIVQSNIDKYGKGEVPINLQRNKDYWEDQKEK